MESDRTITNPSSEGLSDGLQRIRPLHGRTSGPTRRSTKGQWTAEEDEILCKAVQRFKGKNWKKIAECFKDRTDVQCLHRWQKVLNPELVKGPWSKEEDEIIIELVNKYGPKKWSTIAQHLPGRIGKQCRERWHNHLNPAINKEAWTQEEELALIRAHQMYGNRWAELTKFLPGRTDNAIKNHWNSSVKKKLDSYLASGLLEQFQGLPLVGHQSQSIPSACSRVQSSGDDSGPKGGTEAEEISECSQDSNVVGCSQSASDLANAVVQTREEFQWTEVSGLGKEISSPASCSAQYYTSLEDVTFSIPEIPCQVGCSSKFLEQNFTHDAGPSASRDYQFNLQDFPNISSVELGQESSGLPHVVMNVQFQTSMGFSAPTSMGNLIASPDKAAHVLISDDECCRILFSEAMNDGCFPSGNLTKGSNIVALGGGTDSLLCQPSNIQISEAGRASQSYCPPRCDVLGASCCQSLLSVPSSLSADDGTFIYSRELNQLNSHSFGTQEQQFVTSAQDGFIFTNDSANSPCNDGTDNTGLLEPPYLPKDPLKLVPVNTFSSGSDVVQACPSVDDKPNGHTEEQDAGTLCYEPPRFPSLDIPFFSCDLIQSGGDSQQEYSPLGIRQLMMSSMNCITPFRLWDSPSRDESPDALLKSAAKTFTGTPSILKKRNRDFLLSPLSDRRIDKKLETDMTSSLARDFSRLDVMFDESGTHRLSPSSNQRINSGASIEDKENWGRASDGGQEKGRDHTVLSDDRISEKNFENSHSQDNTKQGTIDTDAKTKVDGDVAAENVQQPSGILIEHNMNDLLLFSPDQVRSRADRASGSSIRTPRNQYHRIAMANQGVALETPSGNPCLLVSSPTVCRKNNESHSVAIQSVPSSAPMENKAGNAGNDATNENFGIFGETPFKRSIESPSAWKSPWFINSFLPGPRVDTDITIEDIGYFMSPGERSYDALGLMKQLSEHTAAAYADALEVLGSETPDTILKERHSSNQKVDQENNSVPHNQLENHPHLASNVLTERRILDFSDCGTPGKDPENGKSLAGISFSSPSSYLLKGCR